MLRIVSHTHFRVLLTGITLFLLIAAQPELNAQSKTGLIYQIQVASADQAATVQISWKIQTANSSPLIVKRSLRPMSTPRLIQLGKQINSEPLSPQSTTFTEKNTPIGVHYYAVLTSEQLQNIAALSLVAGENYTSAPFILTKGGLLGIGDSKPLAPVSELVAINTKNSVFLSWAPALPFNKGMSYNIYRSLQRLSTKQAVNAATQIGTGRQVNYFEDSEPLNNKQVYYGVVAVRDLNAANFSGLREKESFIAHIYKKEKSHASTSELVAINTKNSVFLSWAPALPFNKGMSYNIYRSLQRLSTKQAVNAATQIGTGRQVNYFEDREPLNNKQVYYGVVAVRDLNAANFSGLREKESFIAHIYKKEKSHASTGAMPHHPTIGYHTSSLAVLDLILANTYLKGYYGQCISQVSKYLHSATFNDSIQAKANFFLGVCYYRRRIYSQAALHFSDPLVKLLYPRRSRFWFERAVSK